MSLYIGTNASDASLIATAADENMIRRIIFKYFIPKIGQVKLVAHKNNLDIPGLQQNSGIYSLKTADLTEFNGWVYLDGKKYSRESFPEAYDKFKTSASTNWFQVPTFDHFFNATNSKSIVQILQWQNAIMHHTHPTNSVTNSSYSGRIVDAFSLYVTEQPFQAGLMIAGELSSSSAKQITTTNYTQFLEGGAYDSYKPALHNGCGGSTSVFKCDLNVDVGTNFSNFVVGEFGTNAEIWPKHQVIGAMTYIGIYKG